MNEQQKANMLNHADFLEKVVNVETGNGVKMAVYFSDASPADEPTEAELEVNAVFPGELDLDDINSLEQIKGGDCNFSACAIGWSVANPDLPAVTPKEDWDGYCERVFGTTIWGHGNYCFAAWLNTESGPVIAERMRKVVKAYPKALIIEEDMFLSGDYEPRSYEEYLEQARLGLWR